ncbi:MAG: isochorismatase family protein [Actinomycetota bacterium]|nr:isochorismatase family protein [Actinomycetota bacterium]
MSFADGFAGALKPGNKPALLVIDMMKAYFMDGSPFQLPSQECVYSTSRLIVEARKSDLPIVFTRVIYREDGKDGGVFTLKVPALRILTEGSQYIELHQALEVTNEDFVVTKQYASAFFGTSLSATLRTLGVDTLLIAGVSTSGCVRASALDAMQNGFIPFVVSDAVGDRDEVVHSSNLYDIEAKYAQVVNEATAISIIGKYRK